MPEPMPEHDAPSSPQQLLAKVLEVLPVGVWIIDETGRIVHGNPAGRAIWAGARFVRPEEFGEYKGWWAETGERIAAHEWAAARAIHEGETSLDEVIDIECFDGTRKTILNSALPLRDADGAITGAIVVNQDITERRRSELERARLIRERERARAEVRTLKELLPICAGCKKIRDVKGEWQPVEAYIQERTGAELSHGLCEVCVERFLDEEQRLREGRDAPR